MSNGLGRRPAPDERDRNYPMKTLVQAAEPYDRTWRYWWANGQWADQGATGTCVGHAWAHYVDDGPITHPGTLDPIAVYLEAVLLDPWPANDNGDLQYGTSVRAGVKVLQNRGWVSEYRWAWDAATLADAILRLGPVVVGTNWYTGMFNPTGQFVVPTGSIAGGHAYLVNGYNQDGWFRIKNSWGRSWGNKGHAFITYDDMDRLLAENGEACIATEIPSTRRSTITDALGAVEAGAVGVDYVREKIAGVPHVV